MVLSLRLKILLLLFPFALYGVGARGELLRVGVVNFEPYGNKHSEAGVHVDVVKAIFQYLPEYQLQFVYLANHRLEASISHGQLDVATNIFSSPDLLNDQQAPYLSQPVFKFRDAAITLRDSPYKIDQISDLKTGRIAAYQGATETLGKAYQQAVLANKNYAEFYLALSTTALLLKRRVDVRVGDVNVFYHDLALLEGSGGRRIEDFEVKFLWPDLHTHMAFGRRDLRDKVDLVIERLKEAGEIERIHRHYRQASVLMLQPNVSL